MAVELCNKAALGQNSTLKDGKLSVELNKWFVPIVEKYPLVEGQYLEVRTRDFKYAKEKKEAIASVNNVWLRLVHTLRTSPQLPNHEFKFITETIEQADMLLVGMTS